MEILLWLARGKQNRDILGLSSRTVDKHLKQTYAKLDVGSRVGAAAVVIPLSIIALSLDGVDGALARRQMLESRFGAAFDMEVDSAFALVLSILAALGPAGPAAADRLPRDH